MTTARAGGGSAAPSLSVLALGYMLVVVGFCTLAPGNFGWPSEIAISLEVRPSDVILNVALFVVPGFLMQAQRPAGRAFWVGLAFGLACSLCIEVAQLFLPSRFTSPIDLMTNALGGAIGAVGFEAFRGSVHERAVRRLLTELPLMGAFYLLLPLLWLGSLTATRPSDVLVAPILGLVGAIILASVWKHRLRGVHGQAWVGLATGTWFFVGSLPALVKWPVPIALCTCLVGMAAYVLGSQSWMQSSGRRFEGFTLVRVMPVFALYLFAPLIFAWAPFAGAFETQFSGFEAQGIILQRVEHLTAFSVMGYLLAESAGRWHLPAWQPALVAIIAAVGIVLLLWLSGHGASGVGVGTALVIGCGGALCGVGIYTQQLAALRAELAQVASSHL